ncbi:FliH/SctL family protein [Desulforamulus aeronauticus]|uniref:Flagellar assembly protein FliH n=1 Tax=Desulforamulus aeronauticus DSM 10349 TaxID=1121421 RepID=A0A1M6RCR0_9FIRM|nr:FliH/SctL family protein [Desulforamulus aeronauticus]SHK30241.1 flagellar assembly protein FliH [Desulforamulus aeronauticus DSM 10349]
MSRIIKDVALVQADQVLPLRELVLVPVEEVVEEAAAPSPEELLLLAKQQAEEMIAKAKEEANRILQQSREQAQIEAQQLKEQAQETGWQEGIHAAEDEAASIRQQAKDVLKQAGDIFNRTLDQMEPQIVELSVDIAERVVMTQLAVEPRTIMEIAKECIELVKNRPVITIYVNQVDFGMVEEGKNQLLQGLPGKVELNLLVDNGVQPGGCRFETEQGQVDATLETRWQEAIKALYGQEE